jgi:hypothetical protein
MFNPTDDFGGLVSRVQAGDRGARAQFKRDLEPDMAKLLTRALAQGDQASPLGRRLLQAAQRLAPDAPVGAMAGSLSRLVLDRLQPGSTETRSLTGTQVRAQAAC